MKILKNILWVFLVTCCCACGDTPQPPSVKEEVTLSEKKDTTISQDTAVVQQETQLLTSFICYKNDKNPELEMSIGFDQDGKAQQVQYKGQTTAMSLVFEKEEYVEGGAHPTIHQWYEEMLDGHVNGVYQLTHSGIWDYATYTRGKDQKVFDFTIDHHQTVVGGDYRQTPCY